MGKVKQVRCWFEVEGKLYGPAIAEITEEAYFTRRLDTFSASGTFVFEENPFDLFGMPELDSKIYIVTDDGLRAEVVIVNLVNGWQGRFHINGDWQNTENSRTHISPLP